MRGQFGNLGARAQGRRRATHSRCPAMSKSGSEACNRLWSIWCAKPSGHHSSRPWGSRSRGSQGTLRAAGQGAARAGLRGSRLRSSWGSQQLLGSICPSIPPIHPCMRTPEGGAVRPADKQAVVGVQDRDVPGPAVGRVAELQGVVAAVGKVLGSQGVPAAAGWSEAPAEVCCAWFLVQITTPRSPGCACAAAPARMRRQVG